VWSHREASGDVYVGNFKDDERHGNGVITRVDGSVETVTYNQGVLTEWTSQVSAIMFRTTRDVVSPM
jgi:hypothetical protein